MAGAESRTTLYTLICMARALDLKSFDRLFLRGLLKNDGQSAVPSADCLIPGFDWCLNKELWMAVAPRNSQRVLTRNGGNRALPNSQTGIQMSILPGHSSAKPCELKPSGEQGQRKAKQ